MTQTNIQHDPVIITCRDGYELAGDYWYPRDIPLQGTVIINTATGVRAKYYHRFSWCLVEQGFGVLTYDYRGIGGSRPDKLAGSGIRWRDWGELDFAAALEWLRQREPAQDIQLVGHSIGGFLPGFAPNAGLVRRMLTVGAQYAWHGDYQPARHRRMWWKWHVAMPALALLTGYFPGRRLGWLEDLPRGVALEWARRGEAMEDSYPRHEREALRARFAAVRAPILAVTVSDDDFATPRALWRTLRYYRCAERRQVLLTPQELGHDSIGHFGLFHDRHRDGFWSLVLSWLRHGDSPWPDAVRLAPLGCPSAPRGQEAGGFGGAVTVYSASMTLTDPVMGPAKG